MAKKLKQKDRQIWTKDLLVQPRLKENGHNTIHCDKYVRCPAMNNIGPVPQIDMLTDMTCKLTSSSSTCYSKLRPKDQNQCKISIMKQNKHYTYGSKLLSEQSIKHSNVWYTLQIQFTKSVKHSFRFRNNKLFQPRAPSMIQ